MTRIRPRGSVQTDSQCETGAVLTPEHERLLAASPCKPARERLTLIRIVEKLRAVGFEGCLDAVQPCAKDWTKASGEERFAHQAALRLLYVRSGPILVGRGLTVTSCLLSSPCRDKKRRFARSRAGSPACGLLDTLQIRAKARQSTPIDVSPRNNTDRKRETQLMRTFRDVAWCGVASG